MSIVINTSVPSLPTWLTRDAVDVDLPTIGHFLEEGFCHPSISRQAGDGQLFGRAITVRITATDSTLVHKATSMLQAGDILVIDTGGDERHAPVGGIVGHAIAVSGAGGVVIDGACTDRQSLRETSLCVYARGASALTTKVHGLNAGGINVPITCGGVSVVPGDVVVGDENGIFISSPLRLEGVLERAREAELREIQTIERIRAGEKLPALSAADRVLAELGIRG